MLLNSFWTAGMFNSFWTARMFNTFWTAGMFNSFWTAGNFNSFWTAWNVIRNNNNNNNNWRHVQNWTSDGAKNSAVFDIELYRNCNCIEIYIELLLLFDDDKIKIARKTGKKQEGNPVGCIGEGKRCKGNIREGSREGKTGTVLELSLEARWPLWGWL